MALQQLGRTTLGTAVAYKVAKGGHQRGSLNRDGAVGRSYKPISGGGGFFLRVDIFFAAVAPAAALDLAAAAAFEAASLARWYLETFLSFARTS